jgi:maleylpyruvate isomerase
MADPADSSDTVETVRTQLDALTASTGSLLGSVSELTDPQAREPSLLPGWTRGHVLTHLARNADAIVNLVTWARTGEETPMYASRAQRNADIEAGSGRPATELVQDVRATHDRLLAELQSLPAPAWSAPLRWGSRNREGIGADIPHIRRVEVEVHHVDLNLDYTLAHLPEDFVERMLADVTADFSADGDKPGMVLVGNDNEGRWTVRPGGPEVTGPPPSLLGWLLGRTDGVGLHSAAPLPKLGAWR